MRVWVLVLAAMLTLALGGLEVLASLSASREMLPASTSVAPWR